MANSDDYVERREGLSTGAKIGILLVLLIGLPVLGAFGYGVYNTFLISPETRFERAIAANEGAKPFVEALQKHFPDQYKEMREQAIAAIARTGKDQTAIQQVNLTVNSFMARNSGLASMAQDKELTGLLDAQIQATGVIRKSAGACRRALFNQPFLSADYTEAERGWLARLPAAFVVAAASGRDHPADRAIIQDSDKIALVNLLRPKGVTALELDSLGQVPEGDDKVKRQCFVLHSLYSAIKALPQPASMRVTAELVMGMSG